MAAQASPPLTLIIVGIATRVATANNAMPTPKPAIRETPEASDRARVTGTAHRQRGPCRTDERPARSPRSTVPAVHRRADPAVAHGFRHGGPILDLRRADPALRPRAPATSSESINMSLTPDDRRDEQAEMTSTLRERRRAGETHIHLVRRIRDQPSHQQTHGQEAADAVEPPRRAPPTPDPHPGTQRSPSPTTTGAPALVPRSSVSRSS